MPWALVVAGVGLALGAELHAARMAGESDARVTQAAANARVQHAATAKAQAAALSATKTADSLRQAIRASAPAILAVQVNTNTADASLSAARDTGSRTAADTAATVPALRASLEALAAAALRDSTAHAAERAILTKRLQLDTVAFAADSAALASEQATVAQMTRDYAAIDSSFKAVQAERPNVFHRAVHGVITAGAALACGAVGEVAAGPLGAAGGAILCASVVGAFAP